MARLNESASAPMESVDLLKRRFLRQNKEIIRANSDQCIRIRTLEAEQSRMLSENITLREENIRLNHELSKGRHSLALENVGNVRHKLEMFAAGLGGLLAELADAQTKLPEPVALHEAVKRRSPKQSPGRRERPGLNFAISASDEGRLSPIVEGKHYPRKTLDPADIGIVDDQQTSMSDSPDLGPPPVARYDIGDPVKLSPSPSRTREAHDEPSKEETLAPFFNLETRKKRKSNLAPKDHEKLKPGVDPLPNTHSSKATTVDEQQSATTGKNNKSGGKRKLSMREDDTALRPPEDFEYTKKQEGEGKPRTILQAKEAARNENQQPRSFTEHDSTKHKKPDRTFQAAPIRKVLGEKAVNTDPMVSPAKPRTTASKGRNEDSLKRETTKVDSIKANAPIRPKYSASSKTKLETPQIDTVPDSNHTRATVELSVDSLEPATPAVTDILSPMEGSAPSTLGDPVSRDTPPPSELHGRPSRRSRPAVSYAEPKLNVKMRRPGKEFVDAVSDEKSKRSSSLSGTTTEEGLQPSKENALNGWKGNAAEPISPLAPKQSHTAGDIELPASVSTDRERRNSAAPESLQSVEDQTVTVEKKIAAIASLSNRRLSRAREAAEARPQAQTGTADNMQAKSEQDVYDFVDSSSPEASLANRSLPSRSHRRNSSVPEKLSNAKPAQEARSSSRRRETMATNTGSKDRENDAEESQAEAASDLPSRMLTRRKSMMV